MAVLADTTELRVLFRCHSRSHRTFDVVNRFEISTCDLLKIYRVCKFGTFFFIEFFEQDTRLDFDGFDGRQTSSVVIVPVVLVIRGESGGVSSPASVSLRCQAVDFFVTPRVSTRNDPMTIKLIGENVKQLSVFIDNHDGPI